MKEQIKQLWKLCFNDSDAFTDLYFDLRYNDDINLALTNGTQAVAALQMLPYPMTFAHGTIETSYISGACTHPAYRNRGLMRQLLQQAHARMWSKGIQLSTLIPAEEWLFGYYARSGYAPVFTYCEEQMACAPGLPLPPVRLQYTCEFSDDIYAYLNHGLHARPNCIQHSEADFRVILADLRLSGGTVCTLRTDSRITALAVAYPRDNGWYFGELVADNDEALRQLVRQFCQDYSLAFVARQMPADCRPAAIPLGMARIIRAHDMLQRYAAAHPDCELHIALTDNELEANNGYYDLHDRLCTKNARQLSDNCLALTIGQLAEKICSTPAPYMSLMLN